MKLEVVPIVHRGQPMVRIRSGADQIDLMPSDTEAMCSGIKLALDQARQMKDKEAQEAARRG